jgi:hypothetical protein
MIIDLYPVYSTSYEVEHYIEELDGSFTMKDSERFEDVTLNTNINAEVRSYEGFSFADGDTDGIAKAGLVMKLYYSRNSYKVTYEYENAPENAPAVPETKEYRFGSDVKAAEVKETEGYTFSGWDKAEFTMPAEDVVIKGSYTVNSHSVSYEVEGMDIDVPETAVYEYGKNVTVAADLELEGYTFSGWDKEDFAMIAEDVVIKGSFKINKYNITWKNYDGSTLELDEAVEFGTMPSYDGNTPIRKADASFTYTFKGWTPVIEKVTGDKEYMAEYEAQAIIIPADDTPVKTEPANPVTPSTTNDPRLPEEPEIEIAEAPTPLAEAVNEDIAVAEIEDAMIPQAEMKSWALYNLIATIISVITALAMVLSFFRKKEENEEEENADLNEAQIEKIEGEEEEEEKDSRKKSKFLGLIPAILSVIIFIFTEDMRNPMVLKDRYTLLMVIIALATILLAFLSRNKKEEKEEEEREELEYANVQFTE